MIDKSVVNFPLDLDVSRETMSALNAYVALLIKWNSTINLVSSASIDQIWTRHILDSIQVFNYGANAMHWADLGSGGGFPGIVVAIAAVEKAPKMHVTLVEADQRKAVFLRHACQTLGLKTRVISNRIDSISPLDADVLSARALAPLPQLCSYAKQHLVAEGTAIFLKGKSAQTEIDEARKDWRFALESHASITDSSASVLLLKEISHV